MRRCEFIGALASATAATWSPATHAQQTTLPVVGFLGAGSDKTDAYRIAAVRKGLKEAGYVEGLNVGFEYRWAEDEYGRLPALAAELVHRGVAVIVAIGGTTAAMAAKSATATIPVVFQIGGDPIAYGLVSSLNKPGSNATGVASLIGTLAAKQFEILHEMVPKSALIGVLANQDNRGMNEILSGAQAAADSVGQKIVVVQASRESDLEKAFAEIMRQEVGALMICADPFLNNACDTLADLAARHKLPAIHALHEYTAAGGLMSYGASITDALRIAGQYAAHILKGAKAADLPVQRSVKIELSINLKTAKKLGLTVPSTLLVRADEVIE
jgi:putative tryptophan/tyrosine transport system substrate-binding protein